MVNRPLLHVGDEVAVIATSGPCDVYRLEKGVRVLESMGLRCHIAQSCCAREGFLAGDDALRLQDLHDAFASPRIRGIFVARGGYGAQRLLPFIDYTLIKNNPKVFAGYSDVTALHIAFNQRCNLITYHAPMPIPDFGGEEVNPQSLQWFKDTLFTKGCGAAPRNFNRSNLSAPLTGGNLTLIASSLGTPYEIDTAGKILFLEEINEEPYKIDRLLLQLKYAGKFTRAKAILLGDFSPYSIEELSQTIQDILLPLEIPIVTGIPCGHTSPNTTLPLGAVVEIAASHLPPNIAQTHQYQTRPLALIFGQ
ncbi:MAG: LD-carboxypeptidase [Defluviitaleaceae bacterium]|nr:LD-carboxypeptidase [Defluviitaleaceae bacterium]MCL2275354.1 LD-carboxypeptidase [Defluviitaleaceae bacterium]